MRRRAVLGMAGGLVGCAGDAVPAGGGGVRLRELARLRHASIVEALAWHPDGSRLAVMSAAVEPVDLWDTGRWEKVATVRRRQGEPASCAYLPDGRLLLPPLNIDDQWTTMGTLIDGHDGRVLGTVKTDYPPGASRLPDRMALSGDGRRLAVLFPVKFPHVRVGIFDTSSFDLISSFDFAGYHLVGIALSADGLKLAVAGKQNRSPRDEADSVACVLVVDLASGHRRETTIPQPADSMLAVAFVGDLVATGGITGQEERFEIEREQRGGPPLANRDRLWLFDEPGGRLTRVYALDVDQLRAVAVSADGRWLATLGTRRLTLFDTGTLEIAASLPDMVGAYALAWHPNSRMLACTDDDVAHVVALA